MRPGTLIGTLIGALLFAATLAAAATPDAETQARADAETWEALGRADLAQLALNKILLTRPGDTGLLFEIGQLNLRLNQTRAAQAILQQMQALAPDAPLTAQMALAYRAASSDRLRLAGVRRLIELHRDQEAVAELRKLFPHGAPDGDLGVEYFRVLYELPRERAAARAGLAAIAARYPHQPRYRVALADLLTREGTTRAEGLRLLQQASSEAAEPSPRALDAWRRGLLRGSIDAASRASARAYLGRKPDDAEIVARLEHRPAPRAAIAASRQAAPRSDPLATTVNALLLAGRQEEALRRLDAVRAGVTADDPAAPLRAAALRARAADEQAAGRAVAARRTLAEALALAPADPWLRLELVAALRAQGEGAAAQRLVDEGLQRTVAAARQPAADDTPESRRLRAEALGLAADAEQTRGRSGAALALIESAQTLTPDDPWLRYRLARFYVALGVPDEARALMAEGSARARGPGAIESHYAQALLLASLDDLVGARAALATIPVPERSDGMRSLDRRLTIAAARSEADRLRAAGDSEGASAALAAIEDQTLDDAEAVRSLASAWRGLEQPQRGLALIARAQSAGLKPTPELRVLRAELLGETGDDAALAFALIALDADPELSAAQRQRVAAVESRRELSAIERLRKSGDDAGALARLDAALARTPNDAALRDARAELQLDHHRYAAALADLRAVVARSDEPWRVARANGRIEDIEARRDGFVALGPSLRDKPGSAGSSRFTNLEIPFEIDYPLGYDQHLFAHVDQVSSNAGTLPANYDDAALFGQVQARGPQSLARFPNGARQSADGTALALGYRTEALRADVGTTPVGFPVVDIVGGLRFAERLGSLHLTADIARRPVTSSALAYAGAVDPATGRVWGGVRDNRVQLRLAEYDPHFSLSGSVEAGLAAGRNVAGNAHIQLGTSANWRVFERPTQRVFVGLSGAYWHFEKNLEDYTFGHGGYYSPQQYFSLGLPLEWNGRLGRWTYTLRGALSVSYSKIDAAPFYPGDSALQTLALGSPLPAGFSAPVYGARSGLGFGRSLKGELEYALTPKWSLGGTFDIDRSAFYSPNFFSLYLRRTFRPHNLLRSFPPSPPQPYSDY